MKILQVLCEPFECGGQELLICNLFKNMNRKNVEFDFFAPYIGKNENLVSSLQNDGARFFSYKYDNQFSLKNRITFFKYLKSHLKNEKYDLIHINSVSVLGLMLGVIVSRKTKSKIVIHSHNDGNVNFKYKFIKFISSFFLKKCDVYLACSNNAAIFKFPKKIIKENKYIVLKNGVSISDFEYNEKIRNKYRNELNLNNKFVLGHVGRFEEQKNHKFLIQIFYEYSKINRDAVLLLVGGGSLLKQTQDEIHKLNLENKVIYLGIRSDVNNLLQAMDVFVFPSIYEGLGIAVIEAQTSGLSVLCSDKMPKEIELSDNVYKISLDNKDEWLSKLDTISKRKIERKKYAKIIEKKGYNIKKSSDTILNIYKNLVGEKNVEVEK